MRVLLIANGYPDDNDLYNNGFIHRRVNSYAEQGVDVDVFVFNSQSEKSEYIFQGVKVQVGGSVELREKFSSKDYRCVFVHFMLVRMWEAMKDVSHRIRIYVWVHGYEVEAWHRRHFNFISSKEDMLNAVQRKYEFNNAQIKLFRELNESKNHKITFVHVSDWFRTHVVECDMTMSSKSFVTIPNPVDTHVFSYREKKASNRLKILSIRPYTSRKYANDLTVKTILELSNHQLFNELEFLLVGDGELFFETIEPVMHFDNVKYYKGFLTQERIASLHKEFGVFLCPTRWDSQGVSMCEAMASGLVVISNMSSAIPEFVTHEEDGFLAQEENYVEMAEYIIHLYNNPSSFIDISRKATGNITKKCSIDMISKMEISLIDESVPVRSGSELDALYWRKRYRELDNTLEKIVITIAEQGGRGAFVKIKCYIFEMIYKVRKKLNIVEFPL